jgi:hypothetical protein
MDAAVVAVTERRNLVMVTPFRWSMALMRRPLWLEWLLLLS